MRALRRLFAGRCLGAGYKPRYTSEPPSRVHALPPALLPRLDCLILIVSDIGHRGHVSCQVVLLSHVMAVSIDLLGTCMAGDATIAWLFISELPLDTCKSSPAATRLVAQWPSMQLRWLVSAKATMTGVLHLSAQSESWQT